eukprot:scaffold6164_cov89-Skeletonema_dohrnii-CCMP3373.AAC.8
MRSNSFGESRGNVPYCFISIEHICLESSGHCSSNLDNSSSNSSSYDMDTTTTTAAAAAAAEYDDA